MTNKEIWEIANSGQDESKPKKSKDEAEKVKEIKTPTKVLEINRDYIEWFYENEADEKSRLWIKQRIAELTRDHGKINYFSKFKMEFAEEFLSDIIVDKPIKKSLLESLFDIDDKAEQGDGNNDSE
jgi:hypothetical protein